MRLARPLPEPPLAPAASVRRLHLQVSTRLDGLLQGDHLGYLPGPGSEPAEARPYAPGDDVRRMDWAVAARTGDQPAQAAVDRLTPDTPAAGRRTARAAAEAFQVEPLA